MPFIERCSGVSRWLFLFQGEIRALTFLSVVLGARTERKRRNEGKGTSLKACYSCFLPERVCSLPTLVHRQVLGSDYCWVSPCYTKDAVLTMFSSHSDFVQTGKHLAPSTPVCSVHDWDFHCSSL